MAQTRQIDLVRLAATDAGRAVRLLKETRAAALAGQRPRLEPRPVIMESWGRALRYGVDPDRDVRSELLSLEDLEQRRRRSPLRDVLPVLRRGLLPMADAARHIMVVCDTDGRVLWREGNATVLRQADALGFEVGADWSEAVIGTNGVGTPLVVRRPVQVFAAEHFVQGQQAWTCAGAPVTDPRDGRLLGVVDVSGPIDTMHPATLALVDSVAQLAEARLREMHLTSMERLRAMSAPLLARIGGRALAVDRHGWTAAVTGMAPVDRLALPRSFAAGRGSLPALGACVVEPLPGGWLVRVEESTEPTVGTWVPATGTRVALDLSSPRHWSVTVTGDVGRWTHELSPRHAELLYLLAVHRAGLSASELAADMFGDAGRRVTVRAELSRIRRYLSGLLEHRPYRFREDAEVDVALPEHPAELLPHSTASAVLLAREPER